jgi:2-phosphosulfolactate phosphatase
MPALQVLCKKESLDPERLEGRVVIVIDILFATSTIIHALSQGVHSVYPTLDRDEANVVANSLTDGIRAGEFLAEPLPGFAPATPLALGRECLQGKALVYCTTNGTVALRRASAAAFVYPGSLLNGSALARHITREHPQAGVLITCAGSAGHFNMEDFYGAGHLVSHFMALSAGYQCNDSAMAAMLLRQGCTARKALLGSRMGRLMRQRLQEPELEYAARCDSLNVVARLESGRLRRVVS